MVYPEDPFWALPAIPGLYDDTDYSGKLFEEHFQKTIKKQAKCVESFSAFSS